MSSTVARQTLSPRRYCLHAETQMSRLMLGCHRKRGHLALMLTAAGLRRVTSVKWRKRRYLMMMESSLKWATQAAG
jgi:hypothetical protein